MAQVPEHAGKGAAQLVQGPQSDVVDLGLLLLGAGLPEVAGRPQTQALEVAILQRRCQRLDGPQRIRLDVRLNLRPALGELGAELGGQQLTHAAVLGPGILDGFCHSLCAVGGDGGHGLDRVLHALDDLSAGAGDDPLDLLAAVCQRLGGGLGGDLGPVHEGGLGRGDRGNHITDGFDALRDLLCAICRCSGDGLNV